MYVIDIFPEPLKTLLFLCIILDLLTPDDETETTPKKINHAVNQETAKIEA